MIHIEGISKRFGKRQAVDNISFAVEAGEIFGLLGHNGAGKSTTFGVILGLLHADAGKVHVGGHDVATHRSLALNRVGAIYEAPAFYDYLSGWTNLRFLVSLSGGATDERMQEVVALVGLSKRIHDPVKFYSHGMRQRLALAQALLPNPKLILLDEPSEGLDPSGIQEMRELIRSLRDAHGLTVIFSSHLLHEVEQLCDRIAILEQGRLVYCGRWQETAEATPHWRVVAAQPTIVNRVAAQHSASPLPDGTWRLAPEADPAAFLAALVDAGAGVTEFFRIRASLEDFYMEKSKS